MAPVRTARPLWAVDFYFITLFDCLSRPFPLFSVYFQCLFSVYFSVCFFSKIFLIAASYFCCSRIPRRTLWGIRPSRHSPICPRDVSHLCKHGTWLIARGNKKKPSSLKNFLFQGRELSLRVTTPNSPAPHDTGLINYGQDMTCR